MKIDSSIGNGTFAEAKLLVAGVTYYGLEDLLRRFDEEDFSRHYGVVDKKTGKKISPKILLWSWIQQELQKEFEDVAEQLSLTPEELQDATKEYYDK